MITTKLQKALKELSGCIYDVASMKRYAQSAAAQAHADERLLEAARDLCVALDAEPVEEPR